MCIKKIPLTHTHSNTQTHTLNEFVWKVTEVSHCHYTAHGCHFSVSHQYITQTKMCSHTHTHVCHKLTNAQNHCNTNRTNAQPVRYKTSCVSTKQTAFFSSDETPTASANEYKHRYDGYKGVCSYEVILASKTVSSILSREKDTTSINVMGFSVNII